MISLNKVTLAGNLTRDPELRETPSGANVCDMSIAMNDRYKTKDGELKTETCFADITAWGSQAKSCGECLAKGSSVLVEGKLIYDQWESKDGEKRSKLRVRADRVHFIGRPSDKGGEEEE